MDVSNEFVETLRRAVEEGLLPTLQVESRKHTERVEVVFAPEPWSVLGRGNYAAVLAHPDFGGWVVKVYAPGRPGIEEEREVYRRVGDHPAYSRCLFAGERYLVLRRLDGVTLYDAVLRGIPIPEQVIRDVDDALEYARRRGLFPHDVHGRNVMMKDGRGLMVDISDFLRRDPCSRWNDLKRGYYWIYRPLVLRLGLPVSGRMLDWVRRTHRFTRRIVPVSS
jgi:hypothetical protein